MQNGIKMPSSKKIERYYLFAFLFLLLVSAAIFVQSVRKTHPKKQLGALSLFLPDSARLKSMQNTWATSDKGFPAKRQYLTFHFTGDQTKDKTNLESSRLLVKEILATNDTLNGVNFHFSDNASYNSFVQIIDLLKSEGAKRYLVMNNDIWLYNFSSDHTFKSSQ